MSNDIKIHGHKKLVKRGNAIVDMDVNAYQQALSRRNKDKQLTNLIDKTEELENQVLNLNSKLDAILNLLKDK